MPKAATETTTKKATKAANAKTAKAPKEEKVKRPPSAYNQFMKDNLASYKAEHPDLSHKDAFSGVAALWKDAPENLKRGEAKVSRPKKKESEDKENAASKPKSKSKPKAKPKAKEPEVVEHSEEEPLEMDSDE